jgi:hypothetical protein
LGYGLYFWHQRKSSERELLGMNKMVKDTLLPLALLLLVSALPLQAEIYKWVDETGGVHYSQTPPPEPPKRGTETIRITPHPASAATAPSEAKSCGSITLPARRSDPITSLAMYRQAIAVWQKYIDENLTSSDAALQKGVADRRCAIAAANSELQALSGVEQSLNSNYEQVRSEMEELQQRIRECDEPEWADDELSATACKQQYQARLTQLETMRRVLEGSKKMLQPTE